MQRALLYKILIILGIALLISVSCEFAMMTSSLVKPMVTGLVPMVHLPEPAFISPFTVNAVAPGTSVPAAPVKRMVLADTVAGVAPVASARS